MVSNEKSDPTSTSTFDVTLDQVVTITESRYPKMSFPLVFGLELESSKYVYYL